MYFKGRQEERKSAEDTQEGENATIETQIHKLLLDFIFKLVQISMKLFLEQQNILIWYLRPRGGLLLWSSQCGLDSLNISTTVVTHTGYISDPLRVTCQLNGTLNHTLLNTFECRDKTM